MRCHATILQAMDTHNRVLPTRQHAAVEALEGALP
jgi:hypothetical protein